MLNDTQIRDLCENGAIDPYIPSNVQPCSLDIRLGNRGCKYLGNSNYILDSHSKPTYNDKKFDFTELILKPGEFVLADTVEFLNIPKNIVAILTGRSSIGRLGIAIHITAGLIDPQFRGKLTLEICNFNNRPVKLYSGDIIGQLTFQQIEECKIGYGDKKGRYQNDMDVNSSLFYL